MKSFVIHTADGEILRTGYCPDFMLELQALPGEFLLEGYGRFGKDYVDNGVVVPIPAKPDEHSNFDYVTKTWVFDLERATSAALSKRNKLLNDGPDRINPMWWSFMTVDQQNAWAAYRQSLLDVTLQPGYPKTIVWPDKP